VGICSGLAVFSGSVSSSGISGERRDVARVASAEPVEAAAAQPQTAAAVTDPQLIDPADVTRHAVEAAFARDRILDWAARIRSADGPGAFLVIRPDPDGRRPSYPSAVEAYRDIAEVIGAL
jgi:hypothetical protein